MSLSEVSAKINAAVNAQPVRRLREQPFVFLSHAHGDEREVARLAELVESLGHVPWSSRQMPAGADFRVMIRNRLQEAFAVVVLWTPASVTSEWVVSEANRARARSILVPMFAVPGLTEADLPPPFDTLHTLAHDDVAGLAAALGRLAVEAAARA